MQLRMVIFTDAWFSLIQVQGDFTGDGVDLYDDVIAAAPGANERGTSESSDRGERDRENNSEETNGSAPYHQLGNNIQPNQIGRRHQLYVGNLTWVIFLSNFLFICSLTKFSRLY